MPGTQTQRHASPMRLALGGALALALLVSACGQRNNETTPTAPRQAPAIAVSGVEVQRGDIQQALSYSGDIKASGQITVLAKATGRVQQLLVDVGSRVQAGDALVDLEHDNADVQLLQARAGLAVAQAKLAQIQAGGKVEDVAAAQAAVSQQQARLNGMRTGGRSEDIQLAQAGLEAQMAKLQLMEEGGRPEAVAQAEAALEGARAKLESVQKGATQDVVQAAQSAVDADRAAMASAEASLASLGSTSAADVQAVQSQVDSSRALVATAETALANLGSTTTSDVQAAQSAYDAAVAARESARAALDQANNPTDAQVAQARAAVSQAESQLETARANVSALSSGATQGPCFKDKDGSRTSDASCNTATTAANRAVTAAQQGVVSARAQLDALRNGGSPANEAQLQAAFDSAEANVRSARARLETVQGASVEVQRAKAQSDLTSANENLRTAEARLNALMSGSVEAQRQASESQVTAAREKLRADEARLAQILAGPEDEDVRQVEAAVAQAEQQLAIATMPSTDQELRAQRAAVEQARQQVEKARRPFDAYDIQAQEQAVAQARATLDGRRNPYTREDLQAAQATVDQARATLELAELGIRDTRVLAPVDGVVAERQVSPGALVTPATPLLSLVPPSMELVVNVEESQLGKVAEGQQVNLQVAAYPDETFNGTVASIAPTIDPKSRTASVKVVPTDEQYKLRSGMLARLNIVTAARSNVILLPKDALLSPTPNAESSVMVIDENQQVHRAPVMVGLLNDRFAEITAGLREGQLVVVGNVAQLTDGDRVAPQITTQLAYTR